MSVIDDYKKLMLEVRSGTFKPVYLLHGEESFFIDRIADEVEHLALADHERDFNQTILYGRDANHETVKDTCLRFPMMAERQLVIVRELQNWRIDELEKLEPYLARPTPTTVLVLCHKHKKVDGRKGVIKAVLKGGGSVLLSEKVKDDKLPDLLMSVAKSQKRRLGPTEAQLLASHLGSDLAKAAEEGGQISSDHIQRFVGISKEYNVFELQAAIGMRNTAKAQQIAAHFAADPKDNPLVLTIGFLNTYFNKVAMVHTLAGKSPQEMASALKVNPYFLKDYQSAARNYPLARLVEIQRHLRQCDLQSKGVGGASAGDGELLREFLAKAMS
jgi:DNA polymerase-3 subunit delta